MGREPFDALGLPGDASQGGQVGVIRHLDQGL
jgi:hypothetical protein